MIGSEQGLQIRSFIKRNHKIKERERKKKKKKKKKKRRTDYHVASFTLQSNTNLKQSNNVSFLTPSLLNWILNYCIY